MNHTTSPNSERTAAARAFAQVSPQKLRMSTTYKQTSTLERTTCETSISAPFRNPTPLWRKAKTFPRGGSILLVPG